MKTIIFLTAFFCMSFINAEDNIHLQDKSIIAEGMATLEYHPDTLDHNKLLDLEALFKVRPTCYTDILDQNTSMFGYSFQTDTTESGYMIQTIIYDACEYVIAVNYCNHEVEIVNILHKPNCKFCANRKKYQP